jgi:hypothetical protein
VCFAFIPPFFIIWLGVFLFLAAYASSHRVLGMEGFPGRNCVYIVVNVCLDLFPAHRGRGSGVQVQHDASLWVVYNIGRSYAFFTLSYFFAITPALGFWHETR